MILTLAILSQYTRVTDGRHIITIAEHVEHVANSAFHPLGVDK